jgi:hypothetical protein
VVGQAAVQDVGQAVAQDAQRGVTGGTGGAAGVVVSAGPGAAGEGGKALPVEHVGEALVADVAG